jgi:hypothetical protein
MNVDISGVITKVSLALTVARSMTFVPISESMDEGGYNTNINAVCRIDWIFSFG